MVRFALMTILLVGCAAPSDERAQAPDEGNEAPAKIASDDKLEEKPKLDSSFFDDKLALTLGDKVLYVDGKDWSNVTKGFEKYNEVSNSEYDCKRADIINSGKVYIHSGNGVGYEKYLFDMLDGKSKHLYGLSSIRGFYYPEDVTVVPLPEDDETDDITWVTSFRYFGEAYNADQKSKKIDIIVIVHGEFNLIDLNIPDILSKAKNVTVLSKYSDNICAYLQ